MPINTIQQHIIQWLEGDEIAYRQIFDYYYPKLFPACYKSIKQREDCEEIVLNVFLNIWQRKEQLLQVEDFEKYIFRALSNQMVDFQRKNILRTRDIDNLPLAKLGSVDHPELSFKELEGIYQDALNKLPEKQRAVFLMSREQGLSHKEIAEQNRISVNTVNNHIKSAMKTLRNELGEYSGALPVIMLMGSSGLLK